MTQIYLPLKEETTGREQILVIPGASYMDQSQIKEIIHWQTEKTKAELRAKGPKQPLSVMRRQEIGRTIKEYREYGFRRARSSNGNVYTRGM